MHKIDLMWIKNIYVHNHVRKHAFRDIKCVHQDFWFLKPWLMEKLIFYFNKYKIHWNNTIGIDYSACSIAHRETALGRFQLALKITLS